MEDLLSRIKNMVWTVGEDYSSTVKSEGAVSFTDTKDVTIADHKGLMRMGLTESDATDVVMFASAHEGGHNKLSDMDAMKEFIKTAFDDGIRDEKFEALMDMAQIAEDYRVDTTIARERPGYLELRKNTLKPVHKMFADSPSDNPRENLFKEVSFRTYGTSLKVHKSWEDAVDFNEAQEIADELMKIASDAKSSKELFDGVYEYYIRKYGVSDYEDDTESKGGESDGQDASSGTSKSEGGTSIRYYSDESEDKSEESKDSDDKSDEKADETSGSTDGKGTDEDAPTDYSSSGGSGSIPDVESEVLEKALKKIRGGDKLRELIGSEATKELEEASTPTEKEERLKMFKDDAKKIYKRCVTDNPYQKSLWSKEEIERITKDICKGVHAGTAPAYTRENDISRVVSRNKSGVSITTLNGMARKMAAKLEIALSADVDTTGEIRRSGSKIVASKVWKPLHTSNANVFYKKTFDEVGDYVVDLVLDSSGSQRGRVYEIRKQSYVIAKALSIIGIPCRVVSFDTTDHITIIRQLKDFEEDKPENTFAYNSYGENRDGLALRLAWEELKKRPETNKLMIVLSDGVPSDQGGRDVVKLSGGVSRYAALTIEEAKAYVGSDAFKDLAENKGLHDTYKAVRDIRKEAKLMGLYVGTERKIEVEQMIYGTDFAYVGTSMTNFVDLVTKYLVRVIEKD